MCTINRYISISVAAFALAALSLWPSDSLKAQCDRLGRILRTDSCGTDILDLKTGETITALPGVFNFYENTFVRFSATSVDSTEGCGNLPHRKVTINCLSDTIQCTHRFHYKPDPGNPLRIFFYAELTNSSSQHVNWDFGDGTISEGPSTVHTFTHEALYSVCLRVYEDQGCEASWCTAVPVAAAQSTYCEYDMELTAVNMRLKGYIKEKNGKEWPLKSVKWLDGSGAELWGTSQVLDYEVPVPGTYTVCAQYQTQNSSTGAICSAMICKDITIVEPACYIPDMEDPAGKCEEIPAPVCGCDGVTYENECEAMHFGVTQWWAGNCAAVEKSDCHAAFEVRIREGSPQTGYTAVFFNHSTGPFNYAQLDFGDNTPIWQGYIWDSIVHYYAVGDLYRTNLSVWNNTGCISSTTQLLSTDAANLSKTNLPSATDYVYPGDTNGDHLANVTDLLYIGVGYNTPGVPRPDAHLNWLGQFSPNWTHSLGKAANYKHFDCDGSGMVDGFDSDAILKNYVPQPFSATVPASAKMPRVRLHFSKDTIRFDPRASKSIQIDADILVGNPSEPVRDLYGLAFSIKYPGYIGPNPSCDYEDNSFWGLTNNLLWFPKDNYAQRQLDMGFVRINKSPVNGFGKIASISFRTDVIIIVDVIDRSGQQNAVFRPLIGNIRAVDARGNPLDYSVPVLSDSIVLIADKATGTSGLAHDNDQLRLLPNPVRGQVTVETGDRKIRELIVSDAVGSIKWRSGQKAALPLSFSTANWPSGLYIVQARTDEGVLEKKLTVP